MYSIGLCNEGGLKYVTGCITVRTMASNLIARQETKEQIPRNFAVA